MPDAENFYSVSSNLPSMHIDLSAPSRAAWAITSPPMPAHPPPPVPPALSPVHAYGANGSSYFGSGRGNVDGSGTAGVRTFHMDDEEDLYGQPYDPKSKGSGDGDGKGQNKDDNCRVQ